MAPLTLLTLPLEIRQLIFEFVSVTKDGPDLRLKKWLEEVDPSVPRPKPATRYPFPGQNQWLWQHFYLLEGDDPKHDFKKMIGNVYVPNPDYHHPAGDMGEPDDFDGLGLALNGAAAANKANGAAASDADDEADAAELANLEATLKAVVGPHGIAPDGAELNQRDYNIFVCADTPALRWLHDGEKRQMRFYLRQIIKLRNLSITSIGRRTKYQHMLPIMKLSDWPPPVKLLLINRQLYAEAVQWHYARTTLFLNVCQGFSHLSFFEDMLDMIQKQPHSPLRKVRKIFVRFTWDGVFLDAVNAPNTDMLDSVLQCRSQAAYNTIAAGADNLELLTIQWMDTKCDEVAIERRTRITAPFLTLAHRINRAGVPIKVVESEYWAKPGESFARGHPLHTRRVEFWGIVRGEDEWC